jgi:hypothetical protein
VVSKRSKSPLYINGDSPSLGRERVGWDTNKWGGPGGLLSFDTLRTSVVL